MSKGKNVPTYRYLKLNEHAHVFTDPINGLTICNKQILRFPTNLVYVQQSPNIKEAIVKGHIVETDEDEYNGSKERVIYIGRGIPQETFTGGKKVPLEQGKEAKKHEGDYIDNEFMDNGNDADDDDNDDDNDDNDDDNEPEEIQFLRAKDYATLTAKEKKILKEYDKQ